MFLLHIEARRKWEILPVS